MTATPLRLVLVEDADGYAALVGALLAAEPAPPELIRFARLSDALRHLAHADADCVLLDLELPDARGTEGVERLLAASPQVPIVVLTGHDDDALPVQVIRAGAHDLVVKGDEARLLRSVRHAVERRRAGERLQIERMVRAVAGSGARRRPSRAGILGAAALTAAFALQLAVLRHAGGIVLWTLFAAAAAVAWRATARRREDAGLLQSIVEGAADAVFVKDLEGRYLSPTTLRPACSATRARRWSAAPTPSSRAPRSPSPGAGATWR